MLNLVAASYKLKITGHLSDQLLIILVFIILVWQHRCFFIVALLLAFLLCIGHKKHGVKQESFLYQQIVVLGTQI